MRAPRRVRISVESGGGREVIGDISGDLGICGRGGESG